MTHIRTILIHAVTVFVFLTAAAIPSEADDQLRNRDFSELYTKDIKSAVNRGLSWLAAKQNSDGSWTAKIGAKFNDQIKGHKGHHIGVTAIAGLAYLSAGHSPSRGDHSSVVRNALNFVLENTDRNTGYISYDGSRMYSHGFATLFLAEIYGTTEQKRVRRALKRSVRLICHAQNKKGGWRYQPRPNRADISVTVTLLQSLRAAQNAGISVPKVHIEKGMEYVDACERKDGSFRYRTKGRSRTSWALTAAGIVSRQSAGEYKSARVQKSVDHLQKRISRRNRYKRDNHYYYGHYYASQALYQAGWNAFSSYYSKFVNVILKRQRDPGYWSSKVSPTYGTAMTCLVLQLPVRYLPIFQK